MKPRALISAFAALFALGTTTLATRDAHAALTSSEKAQIRDFVAGGRAENASRVRALVARTDLTAEESVTALAEAIAPVPFTDPRGIFLRELAFGTASASSRPLLVHAVTKSLLARADAVYQKYVGGLDHEPRAIAELVAIYAFVDGTIANAGRPSLAAHDANAGISTAAYEECSKALREHVEQNARWLKGDGAIPESVGRVRAQAQSALFDMLPDGLTRRVDAADRLGLKGARRQMLIDFGILYTDTGKVDDAKLEKVKVALGRLPGARIDLSLVYAGDERGPLRSRGLVAFIGGPTKGVVDPNPFGEEVEAPGPIDATVSAMIEDLAVIAVKRALENRGELRTRSEKDAAAADDKKKLLGRPEAPSVEHVVGAAAHLLLLDAPRTIDLAFARALKGRPESAALLADALGALAAFAAAPAAGQGPQLDLAKGSEAVTLTAIRLAPTGDVASFTLGGKVWAIERAGGAGAVSGITRDALPISLGNLSTAKPASGMPTAPKKPDPNAPPKKPDAPSPPKKP
ncbi:MAG: hypothetical protein JST00_27145 [Deltaproteobacteria bacterium]|nr:hypothetical protein [Deltaproteobacteria bacterium]